MSIITMIGNAHMARAALDATLDMAVLGDDAARLVAGTFDDAAERLFTLTGPEAQRLIGPRVNYAHQAFERVSKLAARAHAGTMPGQGAISNAIDSVQLIQARLATPRELAAQRYVLARAGINVA